MQAHHSMFINLTVKRLQDDTSLYLQNAAKPGLHTQRHYASPACMNISSRAKDEALPKQLKSLWLEPGRSAETEAEEVAYAPFILSLANAGACQDSNSCTAQ